MKLYFHPMSGCSRRVFTFIKAHQLEVDLQPIKLEHGEHKQPDYLKLNPTGRVPTLEDGELVLWESGAILRYLATKHHPRSLGEGDVQRALVDQWMLWSLIHLGGALSALNAATGLKLMRGQPIDADEAAQALATVNAQLAIMGTALEQHLYLCGDEPTLADFSAAGNLESSMLLAKLQLEDARVARWLERLQALPHWPALPTPPKA